MLYQIKVYELCNGSILFDNWLDASIRSRILVAVKKLELGNFSRAEKGSPNVDELKLDFGPGYRIYYAKIGKAILLILSGGSKKRQQKDIDNAQAFYDDYKERMKHGR